MISKDVTERAVPESNAVLRHLNISARWEAAVKYNMLPTDAAVAPALLARKTRPSRVFPSIASGRLDIYDNVEDM
jgi:hypothetical protein